MPLPDIHVVLPDALARREDVVDETAMPRGDPNAHRGYTGN